MNWQIKLSNWLSGNAVDKSQKQVELAQAKLKQYEKTIENLKQQLKQSQTDIERYQAQLKISEGFQIELGETQIKLQSAKAQAERCQQELKNSQETFKALESKYQIVQAELSQSQDWYRQTQIPIEVVNIKKLLPKNEFDTLWGFGLGSPKGNSTILGGSLVIKGWVLGRKSPVNKVVITHQKQTILEAEIGQARPNITQQYPDIPQAGSSGFEASLALVGMPAQIDLVIEAILEDQSVIPLCGICLQK